MTTEVANTEVVTTEVPSIEKKRGRGRPPGSKNVGDTLLYSAQKKEEAPLEELREIPHEKTARDSAPPPVTVKRLGSKLRRI